MEVAPGGLSAIGLDWKALLFQLINFAILLWVLKRFAYAPIVKLLEARRQKIAESLRTADRLAHEKEALEHERRRRLEHADQEAAVILKESKDQGANLIATATQKAQHQAEQIEAQAQARVAENRRALQAEVQGQALRLVKAAAEKVLRHKLDDKADHQLVEQALKEVNPV